MKNRYEIQERIANASCLEELNEIWKEYDKGLSLMDRCTLDRWMYKARRRVINLNREKRKSFEKQIN